MGTARRHVIGMAASEARHPGVARGDSPLEQYVRQLLRDADRMQRSARARSRPDAVGTADRSPVKPPLRPPPESATDDHPRVA
jgi:hypothetical protein